MFPKNKQLVKNPFLSKMCGCIHPPPPSPFQVSLDLCATGNNIFDVCMRRQSYTCTIHHPTYAVLHLELETLQLSHSSSDELTKMTESLSAEMTNLVSGERAQQLTLYLCLWKSHTIRLVRVSHTYIHVHLILNIHTLHIQAGIYKNNAFIYLLL